MFKFGPKYNCEKRASNIALSYGVDVDKWLISAPNLAGRFQEDSEREGGCKPLLMSTATVDGAVTAVSTDGFIAERPLDRPRSASLRRQICSILYRAGIGGGAQGRPVPELE